MRQLNPRKASQQPTREAEIRGLIYPSFVIPGPGEATPVADGVLWLRLPLPFALNHINVYAVADGDGWWIIDTGVDTAACREGWDIAFGGALGGRPVHRVLCTHMHPDHIGLAGWIADRFGAPLSMSRLEYVTARMLLADTGQAAPEEGAVFYRAAGWTDEQIERWRAGFGMFGRGVAPMPQSYHRLSDGDRLTIGGREWRIVVGSGHSPEHVCLWREQDGVFLSGDQILPRISSNVSVWPTEPEADPLGDWMDSLRILRETLPEDLLVLPSHGEPFRGVHTRLEALIRGHEVTLKRLHRRLKAPARAVDVFGSLFARQIDDGVLGMATGESLAHLNYLAKRGRVRRQRDDHGVDWWSATSGSET